MRIPVLLLALAVLVWTPAGAQPVFDPVFSFHQPASSSLRERPDTAPPGPAGLRSERRADLPPTEASLPAEVIVRALSLMGIGYRWGGNIPETGMDCSGFVRHVFHEAAGLILPRKSEDMSRATISVGRDFLLPGDLVFFNTQRRGYSHVGIYLGDDKFVHAPAKGKPIRIDSMRERYWVGRYDGARRVMGELPSQDPAALEQVIERSLSRLGIPLLAEAQGNSPAGGATPREAFNGAFPPLREGLPAASLPIREGLPAASLPIREGLPAASLPIREGPPAGPLSAREVASAFDEAPAGSREVYGWRATPARAAELEAGRFRESPPVLSRTSSRDWRAKPVTPRSLPAIGPKKKSRESAKAVVSSKSKRTARRA